MDLDTVKASLDGVESRLAVLADVAVNVGLGERLDLDVAAAVGVDIVGGAVHGDMVGAGGAADDISVFPFLHLAHSPKRPELHEDVTALCVHGVGHLLPTGDLLLGVDTGRAGEAARLLGDERGLGDLETTVYASQRLCMRNEDENSPVARWA